MKQNKWNWLTIIVWLTIAVTTCIIWVNVIAYLFKR